MQMRFSKLGLAGTMLLAGCSAGGVAGEDYSEPLGEAAEEVGTYLTKTYPAGSGANESLVFQRDDICMLQGFTGAMRYILGSGGSDFELGVSKIPASAPGVYKVFQSSAFGPGATVSCFPRSRFTGGVDVDPLAK